jgi:serine/threonine-protein kinase
VLARALGKKPDERYASAREFHAAFLQAFQGKALATSRQAGEAERTLDPAQAAREERVRATGPGAATFTLPPERLAEVERSLSTYIGPLARVLVGKAQGRTANAADFIDHLATNIEDADDRAQFLARMKGLRRIESTIPPAQAPAPRAAEATGTRVPFSPELLANAEKRLASYVGPLARVLIKDAAGKSGNLKELYLQLAEHIDDDEERKAFLASVRQSAR